MADPDGLDSKAATIHDRHRAPPFVNARDATIGTGSSTSVVKEKEVVREREPRDKVIVREKTDPAVVEKKTVIHRD